MRAQDVMTRSVVAIREDAAVRDAARLLVERKISGLPVVAGPAVSAGGRREPSRRRGTGLRSAARRRMLAGPPAPPAAAPRAARGPAIVEDDTCT